MSNISQDADVADDIPTGSKVVETILLCIIITVSLVGNTSLWIVVIRTQKLRTITNMFILGLSAADLLVATVNMPITVYTINQGNWVFSDDVCVVFGFINMLTLVTSVLSLCNISINRFYMVCRPTKFQAIYTTRNAILMIIGTVASAVLLSSPPLLGWSSYVYTHTHSFCFADWVNNMAYAYVMIVCCFGIPCGVMTFCNICIIRAVRRSRRHIKRSKSISSAPTSYTKCESNTSEEQSKQKKKDSAELQTNSSELSDISSNETSTIQITQTDLLNKTLEHVSIDAQNRDKVNTGVEFDPNLTSKHINADDTLQRNIVDMIHCNKYQASPVVLTGNISDGNSKGSACKQRESSKSRLHRREEIRLAVSLIVVVLLFVICWMPYCISMLISIHYDGPVPRPFHMFTLLLGYANSGCNPIVYGLMNRRFKVAFNKLFCFWSRRLTISGHSGGIISGGYSTSAVVSNT